MSRKAKAWLWAAVILTVIGCILFGCVMTVLHWDFTQLSTTVYETNEHEIPDGFRSILIQNNTSDVRLVPADGDTCLVVCHEEQSAPHSVSVKDGTLVIEVLRPENWYDYVGIQTETSIVTVYLPRGDYDALTVISDTGDVEIAKDFRFQCIDISEHTGDVINYASASQDIRIRATTGSIHIEDVSAGSMELAVSTGNITASKVICNGALTLKATTGKTSLTDMTCQSVTSSGSTGDLFLKSVIASGRFSIERSTGDVRFERCDAAEIFVRTDTGDVEGSLLSDKVFLTQTDTGDIVIPHSGNGGRCEITTDTGDIRLHIDGNA